MTKKLIFILMAIIIPLTTGCGGGMFTTDNTPEGDDIDGSYTTPWGNVTITKNAFIFGSDYPADIVIPDVDGMRSTAFVVSFMSPSGVLAIDLETSPLQLSQSFAGVISPSGTGFPGNLYIMSTTRAFLLTSSHVIDFNPTTGNVNTTVELLGELDLGAYHPISGSFDVDGDGSEEDAIQTVSMSYPSDLAVQGDKLFITMSNLISPILPAIAGPGTVRVFQINSSNPYLTATTSPIITSDFNPTGVTPLPDGTVAITNSGVSDIFDAVAHPITNSSIDIIDPSTNTITANISLGAASLSFKRLAVTSDGSTAYVGSASYGELYAVDLENLTVLYSLQSPITVTGNDAGSDYFSAVALSYDDWYLFAASFDNSAIYPVDAKATPPDVLPLAFPNPFTLGFPKGVTAENPTGVNTGIGDIAIRPGIPGVDYDGPDIFAITGNPGTLVTINTHGTEEGSALQIKTMEIEPSVIEVNSIDDPLQLSLKIEFGDGTIVDNIHDTFTNPFSGYPTQVKWKSSNPSVATINLSGALMPKGLGSTTISASIGQQSAEASLNINTFSPSSNNPPPDDDPEDPEEPVDDPEDPEDPQIFYIPYVPIIHVYIDPDILEILMNLYGNQDDPDEIEILTEAPPGTDPFADEVTEFNPGDGFGFGNDQFPDIVLGSPEGNSSGGGGMDVLSLGFEGEIILEMTDFMIADGDGVDFIVFENAFFAGGNPNNPFSEPAIVSVSDDGNDFVAFDCSCNTADKPLYPGCAGTLPTYASSTNGIDATDPAVAGGNAFDLADVGLESARFVMITDCGVSGNYSPTAGFDLDAISVVNGALVD